MTTARVVLSGPACLHYVGAPKGEHEGNLFVLVEQPAMFSDPYGLIWLAPKRCRTYEILGDERSQLAESLAR